MDVEPSYSEYMFDSDGGLSAEARDPSTEAQGSLYNNGYNERNDVEISTIQSIESNQTKCSGPHQ